MNRRDFVRTATAASLAASPSLAMSNEPSSPSEKRPNILFLFAEQHHPGVLSPAGHPVVQTPHLQQMANEGVAFDTAYCATPLCIPSRTSTILGRYSHHTGIVDNDNKKDRIGDQPNLARHLRQAGYRTCHIGKTHLGTSWDESRERMDRLGFAESLATRGKIGAAKDWEGDPYNQFLKEEGVWDKFEADYQARNIRRKEGGDLCDTSASALEVKHYHDQWVSDRSAEWLEGVDASRPFYLSVNWVGPHVYRDPPGKYATMYDPADSVPPIEDPLELAPQELRRRQKQTMKGLGPDCWRKLRAAYYGQISLIDDGIGAMLATLRKRGLLDNTIVIYSADHGEMLCDHGMINKTLMYEGSAGVPFIVRYPRLFPAARPKSIASLVDLAPTLLELAGAEALPVMHGQSMLPVLTGQADDRRTAFSEFRNTRMIRDGAWKYVTDPDWEVDQLFNLEDDPKEVRNRIKEEPKVVSDLEAKLEGWLKQTS